MQQMFGMRQWWKRPRGGGVTASSCYMYSMLTDVPCPRPVSVKPSLCLTLYHVVDSAVSPFPVYTLCGIPLILACFTKTRPDLVNTKARLFLFTVIRPLPSLEGHTRTPV